MSLKVGNILSFLIGIELVVFLGVFFYTFDTFWFSAGLTMTLMLFTLIIILKIFSTSSTNPQILGEPISKKELTVNFSDTINKTKEDLSKLKENLSMQDENKVSKVIEIKDQFNSIIQEIKSKIDQENDRNNNIQLTQKIRDVHISDIEEIFKSEIENFNQNLPALEKIVQSKINDLEINILKKIDLNFEKTKNMINNIRIDEELQDGVQKRREAITEKSYEEKIIPEEVDVEVVEVTIDDHEKGAIETKPIEEDKIEVSPLEEIESEDLFDDETENLIEFVNNKFSFVRYETIELLQAIEKNHKKEFSNKEFMKYFKKLTYKHYDEINSIISLIRKKPIILPTKLAESEDVSELEGRIEIVDNAQNQFTKTPGRETFNLIGRENEIITIKKFEPQIEHNGSKYKIQKTMGGDSLDDLKKMEVRVEKFFKNREILIVFCDENKKFFIYYK